MPAGREKQARMRAKTSLSPLPCSNDRGPAGETKAGRGSGGLRLSFGTGEVGREDEVGHTHSRLVLHLSLLTPGVFDSAWVRVGLLELGGPSMSLQQREQDS